MLNSEEILHYAGSHTTAEPVVLERLNRETHLTQIYPQMLSGHLQGTLLRMIVQMLRPDRVLEIGTFTGYAAIAMGLGLSSAPVASQIGSDLPTVPAGRIGGVLHTIEVNPELEYGIRRFITEAGLDDHIVLHIGEALEIIPALEEIWDLVFIDADKPNYLNYYNLVLPRLRTGGFIIADNVLWDGKVTGAPGKMDKDTRGIVSFNDFIQCDDRVENLLLPVRDGLMLIRKR